MFTHTHLLFAVTALIACGEKSTDTGSDTEVDRVSDETEESASVDFEKGVSTIAGSGEYDSVDGVGIHASFGEPKVVRMRDDGVLIVGDTKSGQIRTVTLDGIVTTMAISGTLPVAPSGLAFDGDVMYISDYDQHCIYKVEGLVSSVFAGTCGEYGYQNGGTALFENPRGLLVDPEGDLLVADAGNSAIRSISPTGEVRTIVGTAEKYAPSTEGPALEANLYLPFGLAYSPEGDLFISGFDHCIRRVHNGNVEDIAGLCRNWGNVGTEDGLSMQARFDTPLDIAFTPNGELVIADSFNDTLRILSADLSTVRTLTGSEPGYRDGALEDALFEIPRSVTTDAAGRIYVADSVNHMIRVVVQ